MVFEKWTDAEVEEQRQINMLSCLHESEMDTIEIALRKRMEDSISAGNIKEAEIIEDTIKSLDDINVCDTSVRDLAYVHRMDWLKKLAGV